MSASRYEGKPLLRVLECYVLWAIDQLPPAQAASLERLAPKLAKLYRRAGTWQQVIAAEMEFGDELPVALRQLWQRNLATAEQANLRIDPEEFARQVVDTQLI